MCMTFQYTAVCHKLSVKGVKMDSYIEITTKDLVVYVTGISGMCSKGYTGCGKSCLCRQFMHNEYMEESYSTLGQAEFESHAINQQHTIYWGQKKQTYSLSNEEMNMQSVTVNFEVFEHTTLYQDGTNEPFRGHDNYECHIFTPYNNFQNKRVYRSRADTLNLETNDSKRFSLSSNVTVAYLYIVDVSQSCSIFEAQMQLMSRLVRSIQNTHCCVVVASKFDTHCEKNVKFLESFANTMNVAVIKCSSKHNANVDTAFECLAMEALSLKHNAAEAQDVTQKQAWIADSHTTAEHFTKRFSTLPNNPQCGSASYVPLHTLTISHNLKTSSCSQDNLVALNKKFTSRTRLSSAFSKIFLSKKSNKATEHHITMPTTYKHNTTFGLSTLKYREAVSSCPDLYKRFQRTSDTAKLSSSVDVLHSDPDTTLIKTEKLLPPMQPNAINQSSGQPNNPKLHFRSTMPLPLTPLDLAITTDSSVSTTSSCTNSISMNGSIGSSRSSSGSISSAEVLESSKADSPFADETGTVAKSDNQSDAQVKKRKHDYETVDVDFESILSLLFNSSATTTVDDETDDTKDLVTRDEFVKIKQDDEEKNASGISDIMTSKTSLNIESMPSTDVSTSPDTKASTWFDEDKDYVISDYEFFRGIRQLQLASANYMTITSSTDKELSYHHRTHGSEQLCKQQYDQNDASQKDDKNYVQLGTNIYDKVNLECVTHTDQCTCEQCDTSDMGDYTFMHATTCPHLGTASQTYDYVDQLYITMLRQNYKKYSSGVPPRKVNRPGCKPLLDTSTCPNNTKTHDATYVNCSNIRRQCGTTLLPPHQFHTNNMDTSNVPPAEPATPPRNIPRLGHYLSAPPAAPTT